MKFARGCAGKMWIGEFCAYLFDREIAMGVGVAEID